MHRLESYLRNFNSATLSTSIIGRGFEVPVVTKEPNETLYDFKGQVKLTCKAGGLYAVKWYKLSSAGIWEVQKAYYNTIRISNLQKNEKYRCEIIRIPLNYRSYKLVNIQVKGNG